MVLAHRSSVTHYLSIWQDSGCSFTGVCIVVDISMGVGCELAISIDLGAGSVAKVINSLQSKMPK